MRSNQIINYFDSNPKSGSLFALLPMLFNYFQNLMLAYYAPNKTNENELAKFLDLRNVWGVRDYTTGMRNYNGVKVMQIINKFREVDAKSKGIDNPNTSAGELMRELVFFILHWCFFSSSWLFSSWSKKLQISVFLLVSFLRFGAFLFLDFSRFFWFSFLFLEKSHGVGEKEFSHFSTEILWCSLGILGLSFVHLSVPSAGSSEQLCRILSRNRIEKCKF